MINISNILENAYEKFKYNNFIYEKISGVYSPINYKDFIDSSRKISSYLCEKGYKDKNIMIIGENSINWMIVDLAVTFYTGVSVTVPKEWLLDDITNAIIDLDISLLIYSKKLNWDISEIKKTYPDLLCLSIEEDVPKIIIDSNLDTNNLYKKDIDNCSKIVFTSGTTSKPKGVMLSLRNIFSGWESLYRRVQFNENDTCYLHLPLHHTYANIYNFLYGFLSGMSIYLSSDTNKISEELLEVNPSIFCSVPYIYEIIAKTHDKGLGNAFGNRIKYLFTGGAPFPYYLKEKYSDAGLAILEAYVLSETSSSCAITYSNDYLSKSVGTLFEDIKSYIKDPDSKGIGELLIKGDNIFLGYAGEKNLNKKVIDKDGYFHTGDLGYIKDNKLYIIGRKDNMISSPKGELISAEKIKSIMMKDLEIIKEVDIYFKDNKLHCDIFLEEEYQIDWENWIKYINTKLLKCERIMSYNIF